jgi:putative PIG3 family NAD(P)H quinone oxidoreductase
MKAVVITRPGGPEVLEYRDVADPVRARGEVLVRVRATAVNRADLIQRMGFYPAPPGEPADIPGMEYAGEVEAADDTSGWKPGDRVFGLVGGGSYAERLVAPARTLSRIPERLSFNEAAACPEAFITAYDAMVTQARLTSGDTVLIQAVGSGVGTAAVQVARALHARAIGTARSAGKLERARALGMSEGVVAENGKFADKVLAATGGVGVDVVLELVGGAYIGEDLICAAPKARIVLVGLLAGMRADVDLGAVLRKHVQLIGTTLRSRPLEAKIAVAQTFARHIVPLLADGTVAPVVDKVLPLAEAGAAHAYLQANEGFGKLVLEA